MSKESGLVDTHVMFLMLFAFLLGLQFVGLFLQFAGNLFPDIVPHSCLLVGSFFLFTGAGNYLIPTVNVKKWGLNKWSLFSVSTGIICFATSLL